MGSDEGGEERGHPRTPRTGNEEGPRLRIGPVPRNGTSVVMTTETEFEISGEPLAERILRQARSGQLDDSRLLRFGRQAG